MATLHAPSPEEETKFKALLSTVATSLPNDASLRSQVSESLEKQWNNPRHNELKEVFGTEWTPQAARKLMFFPTAEQAGMYAQLIRDAPLVALTNQQHPQTKVQSGHMVMLYLHHVPHMQWESFAAPFITGGGLAALASLMQSPNLYLRGQAIDSFLQITAGSASVFDWWSPPVTGTTDKALHDAMIGLASVPEWMDGLLLNSDSATSYPGGPVQTLQLLAFWLSWVRKLYSSNSRIRLSRTLLAALRDWGAAGMSGTEFVDEPLSEELLELRAKLFSDFSREEPIEGAGVKQPGGARQHVQWDDSPSEEMHTVATDVTPAPSSAPSPSLNQSASMAPGGGGDMSGDGDDVIEIGDGGFDISGDDDTPTAGTLPPPPAPSSSSSSTSSSASPPPPPSPSPSLPSVPSSAPVAPGRDFSVVQPVRLSAREQGNAAFAAEHFEEALALYDQALDELDDERMDGDLSSEASSKAVEAVLLCNRATVLLKLHEQVLKTQAEGVAEAEGESMSVATPFVHKCEAAARAAIKADRSCFKAHYRLSQALEQQGRLHEAILAAQAALACNDAPKSADTKGTAAGATKGKGKGKAKAKGKSTAGIPKNARRTIEKLLVTLMERLAQKAEAQAIANAVANEGKENRPAVEASASIGASIGTADGAAAAQAETGTAAVGTAADRQAKAIEREASIMCKILRRKDAHKRHDEKFANKSGGEASADTTKSAAVSPGFLSSAGREESEGDEGAVADAGGEGGGGGEGEGAGALVPRSLSQAVVSTRDEWDEEQMSKGLEMMRDTGSDSDDDMHVFNAKQKAKAKAERADAKAAKLAQKKAARKAAGANIESVSASAGELGLGGGGAAKGERVLKKVVGTDKSDKNKKAGAKGGAKPKPASKKEKALKADKKSQIADLKKMAGGGVSSSLLADLA